MEGKHCEQELINSKFKLESNNEILSHFFSSYTNNNDKTQLQVN